VGLASCVRFGLLIEHQNRTQITLYPLRWKLESQHFFTAQRNAERAATGVWPKDGPHLIELANRGSGIDRGVAAASRASGKGRADAGAPRGVA